MAWRDSRQSSLPARWKRRHARGATRFARPLEPSSGCPVTTYGGDSAETREGPTCGRSANRACQLASSWSRNDHEDGGPTIPLPAADAHCTLRSLSCIKYMRVGPECLSGTCPWLRCSSVRSRETGAHRVPVRNRRMLCKRLSSPVVQRVTRYCECPAHGSGGGPPVKRSRGVEVGGRFASRSRRCC
jgi:hypothetical protein